MFSATYENISKGENEDWSFQEMLRHIELNNAPYEAQLEYLPPTKEFYFYASYGTPA